jgi:hypothetical protein
MRVGNRELLSWEASCLRVVGEGMRSGFKDKRVSNLITAKPSKLTFTIKMTFGSFLIPILLGCHSSKNEIDTPEARPVHGEENHGMHSDIENLRNFIAGKKMIVVSKRSRTSGYQQFFQDGSWTETAEEIDITRRKGRWRVKQDLSKRHFICTTVTKQDEIILKNITEICIEIKINYENSSATLKYSGADESKVSVSFLEI